MPCAGRAHSAARHQGPHAARRFITIYGQLVVDTRGPIACHVQSSLGVIRYSDQFFDIGV